MGKETPDKKVLPAADSDPADIAGVPTDAVQTDAQVNPAGPEQEPGTGTSAAPLPPEAVGPASASPPPSHGGSEPGSDADNEPDNWDELASGLTRLPPYSRSLLKVDVPISVTLACKRQRLAEILRLVPGSIIQFNKSCEDVLELQAAGQTIAVGEAVKVGDNFGLRITSMVLPGERFVRLGATPAARPAS